jgi:hypothetical protein
MLSVIKQSVVMLAVAALSEMQLLKISIWPDRFQHPGAWPINIFTICSFLTYLPTLFLHSRKKCERLCGNDKLERLTWLEVTYYCDKRASLLHYGKTYDCKKIYITDPVEASSTVPSEI